MTVAGTRSAPTAWDFSSVRRPSAALEEYVSEVMTECLAAIPQYEQRIDADAFIDFFTPGLHDFALPYELVMQRACEARRRGARTRAEALEWAFDSLMSVTEYVRVGEVYLSKNKASWRTWVRHRNG